MLVSLCTQCLLSRVLNDDYKKSSDFSLTMMRIFWCFSNFLQLHPILANYRIGAITLKIVEFEIKRHELRLEEERGLEAAAADDDGIAKLEREKKRNKKRMKKQDQLLCVLRRARAFVCRAAAPAHWCLWCLVALSSFVCFSVLLNLAEDIHTERKMVKRKIALLLAKVRWVAPRCVWLPALTMCLEITSASHRFHGR